MPIEAQISEVMAEVGYLRLKSLVYRAEWSTDEVEHFIYHRVFGPPRNLLVPSFGFRNPMAEEFSIHAIRKYGGPLFDKFRHNLRFDCAMQFGFDRLHYRSRKGWQPSLLSLTDPKLALKLKTDVSEKLVQIVGKMTNLVSLYQGLLADEEPCPWVATNGAIRAAQCVALARMLGLGRAEIQTSLIPRSSWIEMIQGTENAEAFILNLVDDWDVHNAMCLKP